MKTNLHAFALLAVFLSNALFAQEKNEITKDQFIQNKIDKLDNNLVSPDTFDHLIYKDFSTIQTGDKNKNVVGRYATLDVNTNKYSIAYNYFLVQK